MSTKTAKPKETSASRWISYRPEIRVIDCTIRDGGLMNNHHFDDQTVSGGVGATLQLVPEKVALIADYTMSLADIDIVYEGFGVTNYNGAPFAANHQFAFSTPPAITEDQQVLNVRLEFPVKAFTAIVGYSYETYSLTDWQQGSNQPWVESVGADTFLRDTSRSFQWGNRLFNLGTYLAPSYDAHMGFVGLRYRF